MSDNLAFATMVNLPRTCSFHGMDIRVSDVLMEQYRFPRGRKRRIRNKWAKRPENWRPSRRFLVSGDAIYAHPQMVERLTKQMGDEVQRGIEQRVRQSLFP